MPALHSEGNINTDNFDQLRFTEDSIVLRLRIKYISEGFNVEENCVCINMN